MRPVAKIEWHRQHPDAHDPFLVKRMSWSWFSAEVVRIQPTELGYRVKGDATYLALHDFVRSDGETTINGGSRSTLTDVRGKLTFVPVGSSVEGWNNFKSRVSSVVAVHLAPPASDHYAGDISDIPPSLYFENSKLKATLQKLQSVLDGSGINDHAYAETLGLLLLWELRHAADLKRPQLNQARGGLTALQLRWIKDFVHSHISRGIGISELASLVGLSQFHFIRAFKHSVGLSPYQYVLSERIGVAREMLSKSDLSIDDVALAVGFRDASQLNRVFRKLIGVTPTAFRRENGFNGLGR
ncbi:AraC family transcriptional regulator [Bradyrhizobium sp. JR4.1]|uniref:AraC family transcriptional regulator n=1 Tax=Bradyrhizobium sp. JR4.1 TaxID=3156372 RepID=UPI0033930E3F